MGTLALACAPTPPERAPLPEVDEVLDPPAQCTFLVGDPQGVLVQEVIPDSAAEGILLAGDVIIAFDDEPTPDSEALLTALSSRSEGDVVDVEFLRNDEATKGMLTLGPNPDDTGPPRIGVMIRTQYQVVPASEVDTGSTTGPLTRPISIAGTIFLFDPVPSVWERTTVSVPDELSWVATTSGLYAIDDGALTDLTTGEGVPHDGFEGWEPVRNIGSVGADLMLVVTQAVPDDPERVAVGISRFDPVREASLWAEPVVEGFGIPVSAMGSPDGESVVVVGVSEGGTEITGVALWDGEGRVVDTLDLTELGTPVGWMDEESVLFRTDVGLATLVTVSNGQTEAIELESAVEGLPLFPVGDGRGVLAVDGQVLLLEDVTVSGDLRVLAENCVIGRIGEPGWGA
jgi:hypothetical protein